MVPMMPPMPGAGGPPMGGPPMMPGLAGGTGPATMPGSMKPQGVAGVAGIKGAVELLQKALGDIPLGSELHDAVLKAVTNISKHLAQVPQEAAPHDVIQQLAAAARQAQSGGGMPPPAMPGAGGPAPAGAPPMPPPVPA